MKSVRAERVPELDMIMPGVVVTPSHAKKSLAARRSGKEGQFSEVSKGVIQNDISGFESSHPWGGEAPILGRGSKGPTCEKPPRTISRYLPTGYHLLLVANQISVGRPSVGLFSTLARPFLIRRSSAAAIRPADRLCPNRLDIAVLVMPSQERLEARSLHDRSRAEETWEDGRKFGLRSVPVRHGAQGGHQAPRGWSEAGADRAKSAASE
jgi:hypothetical protein